MQLSMLFYIKSLLGLLFFRLCFPGLGGVARLFVAVLCAQERPDKSTEFASNGDFGFIALKAPARKFDKAQVQPVLSFPA